MPFGPDCEYADMDECVRKNQDKDDPEGWCAQVMRETEGTCAKARVKSILARVQATQPKDRPRGSWYRIVRNQASDEAELWIYDEISWWGVSAQDLVNELKDITENKIKVHLNSPGGDVFDAIAIYTALKEHKARVEMRIDALAASAATLIAMAGDHISITKPGSMMIHDAWGMAIGNAEDMRAMGEVLDSQSDIIAQTYADRAGGTRDEWRTRMKAESWFNSAEALEVGLVDEIRNDDAATEEEAAKTAAQWDLSIFNYAGRDKAPDPPTEPSWDDIPDEAFVGLGPVLQEVAEPPFDYDPDIVRTAITDRAENAPAPPRVEPRTVAEAPNHIDLEEFGQVLWEALQ